MGLLYAGMILASITLCMIALPGTVWSQEYTDNQSTLAAAIIPDSQYVFRNDTGYGVMAGIIENRGESYISDIRIQVSFYDDTTSLPLDITSGATSLDVIPPGSQSPFLIASSTPDSRITQASARILAFDAAPTKPSSLAVSIHDTTTYIIDANTHNLILNGTIQNLGLAPASNVTLYMAIYDAFEPPRTISVKSLYLGNIDDTLPFEFDVIMPSSARSFEIFAESDVYSARTEHGNLRLPSSVIPVPQTMMLVTISDMAIRDDTDTLISSVSVGQYVTIYADMSIQFSDDRITHETPYTLYVQIKQASESAPVQFIGKYDGRFVDDVTSFTNGIDWIPGEPGLYVAETYVWDRNNIPLAERGPILLILVE